MKMFNGGKGKDDASESAHIISDMAKLTSWQQKQLKKAKIMIATPAYGGQFMGNYTMGMAELMRWSGAYGFEVRPQFLFGATYIELARNYLANAFMKSDCTHLFFIDADVGFIPNHIFELVLADKDIIGGLYPKRATNWEAVGKAARDGVPDHLLDHCSGAFPHHPMDGKDITLGHQPQQVFAMPTGFLCITRQSLAKYALAFPERRCSEGSKGDFGHQYFWCGMITQNEVTGWDGEDNNFCRDMYNLGIYTYLAPWVNLTHFGSNLFSACWPCSIGQYVHIPGLGIHATHDAKMQ